MTYTIKNSPGGYDIYKDGECLSAEEVVGRLEEAEGPDPFEGLCEILFDMQDSLPETIAEAIISAGWRKQP